MAHKNQCHLTPKVLPRFCSTTTGKKTEWDADNPGSSGKRPLKWRKRNVIIAHNLKFVTDRTRFPIKCFKNSASCSVAKFPTHA